MLPHANRAVIDERKVREYLLSPDHPIGRHKAVFFGELGFDVERWEDFADALRGHAATGRTIQQITKHGVKYIVDGPLKGPSGRVAQVRAVWIVAFVGDPPRLITAYPQ